MEVNQKGGGGRILTGMTGGHIDVSVLCIYILLRAWGTVELRSWQELLPQLRPLNLKEFLHLLLSACSVCSGLSPPWLCLLFVQMWWECLLKLLHWLCIAWEQLEPSTVEWVLCLRNVEWWEKNYQTRCHHLLRWITTLSLFLWIKWKQRSLLDDLPELSSCAGSKCGIGGALRQDGEAVGLLFCLLETQISILYKCHCHWQRQGTLGQGGSIKQAGFQHAGKKWGRREQFRAAFLLA